MDINDFKFVKCLGKGGTSDVFLGKQQLSKFFHFIAKQSYFS